MGVEKTVDFVEFMKKFEEVQMSVYHNSLDKGFWNNDRNNGEAIALMHSELSEALEGLRHGNPASDKIPEFSCAEEEFADCIIRIMDLAGGRNWKVAQAIVAKMAYNSGRPYMHGKGF